MNKKIPLEMLERWYVDLNNFHWPDDFPFTKPNLPPDATYKQRYQDEAHKRAWKFVTSQLTDEQQSWAWWKLQLKEPREAWEAWWKNCGVRA